MQGEGEGVEEGIFLGVARDRRDGEGHGGFRWGEGSGVGEEVGWGRGFGLVLGGWGLLP